LKNILVRPIHTTEFLRRHDLGVEAHIGRYDALDNWEQYIPFVQAVHLPYVECNLGAIGDEKRAGSIAFIKAAMDTASRYPVDRMVMHVCGIESKDGEIIGEYSHLIDSIRDLASHAAKYSVTLCLENTVLVWGKEIRRWGDSCAEWHTIYKDVDRENVKLNLDTSHSATEVQVHDTPEERIRALWEFLEDRDAIWRVHWSDSIVGTEAGKKDMHLVPGKGDLPLDFHRAIMKLNVPKLLEQNCTEQEVEEGLNFIQSLN
jgi:sugar phosphate isomerase/epimerase